MDPDFDNSESQNFVVEQYEEEEKTRRSMSHQREQNEWTVDSERILDKKRVKARSKT